MKKVFLSLAAVVAFGAAQAQTNPAITQPAKTVPSTETEVVKESKKEMTVKQDAVTRQQPPAGTDNTQVRKDEMVTTDHVKSTTTTQQKPVRKVAAKKVTAKATTTKKE
jgi:hypothetical protein